MENRNYGHLENGRLVYAQDYALVDGVKYANPTAAMYARCSPPELPIDASAPKEPAPEGKHYEPAGWEERDGHIRRTWQLADDPPPRKRKWSRLTIKTALAEAGMLVAAREYLSAIQIATGYTAWEALTDCDYIEEGYPDDVHWDEILEGSTIALGKTREEIDAFLDSLPTE